jgi:hypothetical protein
MRPRGLLISVANAHHGVLVVLLLYHGLSESSHSI